MLRMGARRSAPNLRKCEPRVQEKVSVYWYCWGTCCFGRNWVEPMPPAVAGLSGTPGMNSSGEFRPKGCCWSWEKLRTNPKRKSLVMAGLRMRVQPRTNAQDLSVELPQEEVLLPSAMPPKFPGTSRIRLEPV